MATSLQEGYEEMIDYTKKMFNVKTCHIVEILKLRQKKYLLVIG